MDQKIYPVCVIGGGSAGIMAVLRTVLNNDECLFFPGSPKDKKRSRALWVRKIENMPAHFQYKRGIEEPNAETLKWIAESPFKDNLLIHKNVGVTSVVKKGEIFEITDSKNQVHLAEYIILCTGVMDVQPEIKGSIETVFDYANAQTIDYCLICDGHHVFQKRASVIGHGNGAAWVAIMLYERYQPENFAILTNGKKAEFQDDTKKLIEMYGIKVYEQEISDVLGQEKGKILEGFMLSDGTKFETDICFVSMGMIVYNEIAKQLGADLDERGFVKAEESGLTSISGLYVAGDLKANTKKQIYTAWDNAVNAANAINMKIRSKKRQQFKKD
ncbi:NAD(P)/FAD-dependent oxidoreductase [Peredibacter starrii]|uniref:NAD(P)/FAD-dependent oxidoreductase n=1 Tax=Peredibacter starrii TaxID=28202 RepID=A0AAX4HRE1_9BACT|nr:NAD(P)/FAD-dependent oxidoreductase [Peredibacter starrii]WPU65673.1 NAD(P)/FAD-dependent oxidoreductase [Peredibacter starrii]